MPGWPFNQTVSSVLPRSSHLSLNHKPLNLIQVGFELMSFVRVSIPLKKAWELLKPHANDLINGSLRPLMGFSARDEEQWQDDPQEYIRSSTDMLEELKSERHSATK
jgi:hypothetical protein